MPNALAVYWRIYGKLKKETEKAYLWKLARTGQEIWLPKSQCMDLNLVPDCDGDIDILVKDWILNDKAVSENDRYSPNDPQEDPKQSTVGKIWDDYEDDIPF